LESKQGSVFWPEKSVTWRSLGVDGEVAGALVRAELPQPSAVQAAAVPVILGAGDVVVAAETGSGKTHTYLAPLVHKAVEEAAAGGAKGGAKVIIEPHCHEGVFGAREKEQLASVEEVATGSAKAFEASVEDAAGAAKEKFSDKAVGAGQDLEGKSVKANLGVVVEAATGLAEKAGEVAGAVDLEAPAALVDQAAPVGEEKPVNVKNSIQLSDELKKPVKVASKAAVVVAASSGLQLYDASSRTSTSSVSLKAQALGHVRCSPRALSLNDPVKKAQAFGERQNAYDMVRRIQPIRAQAVDSELASKESSSSVTSQKTTYYYLIANGKFLLDDEEHFQEQMKEKLCMYGEHNKEQDYWMVLELEFLDKHPEVAKCVGRPTAALVSTDKI
jgi:hypothetical protein